MHSLEDFKQFVYDRLAAAVEEIFLTFGETIFEYEEEINRLEQLLESIFKPEVKLVKMELPLQQGCKEKEVLTDQPPYNQEMNCSLDHEGPQPLQMKEEQKDLCMSQDTEQNNDYIPTLACEKGDHSEGQTLNFKCDETQSDAHEEPVDNTALKSSEVQEPNSTGNLQSTHYTTSMPNIPCNNRTGECKCEVCGKVFTHSYNLNRHQIIHTGDKPYSCDICGKRFNQTSALKTHKRLHTGEKPYSCKLCGKRFTHNSGLVGHRRVHTGEKPYSCDFCGRCFSHQSILIKHERIHTHEKPYSCNVCGKHFSNSSGLISHKRTHTGEKPYSCNICLSRFSYSSTLKRHEKIHTGEAQYHCLICGYTFIDSSALTRHMRTHTGEKPYVCTTCGRGFCQLTHLKKHTRLHIGEHSYSCETCGEDFKFSCDLKTHMKTHTEAQPV